MDNMKFSLSVFEPNIRLSPFQKAQDFLICQEQKLSSINTRLEECFGENYIPTKEPSSITNIAKKALLYFNALTSKPESLSYKSFHVLQASLFIGLRFASTTLFVVITITCLLHRITAFHFNSIDHITSLPVDLTNQNRNNFIFTDLNDRRLFISFHPFPESKSNEYMQSLFDSSSIPLHLRRQPALIETSQINSSKTLSFCYSAQPKPYISLAPYNPVTVKQAVPPLPDGVTNTGFRRKIIYYPEGIAPAYLQKVRRDIATFNRNVIAQNLL